MILDTTLSPQINMKPVITKSSPPSSTPLPTHKSVRLLIDSIEGPRTA